MTQGQPIVKTREAMIQKELWTQENPSNVPEDMLHHWQDGNSRINEDMAQFSWALYHIWKDWPKSMQNVLMPILPDLQHHYLNMDAFSRSQAIEALGKQSQLGSQQEEKKSGIFGIFGGKK